MPFVSVITNQKVSAEDSSTLLAALTDLIVNELNKPKEYVQVSVSGGRAIQFAGTGEPTAFVELRAIGLTEEKVKPVSAALSELVKNSLGISSNRIFLNLLDVPRTRWGWDGSTFG